MPPCARTIDLFKAPSPNVHTPLVFQIYGNDLSFSILDGLMPRQTPLWPAVPYTGRAAVPKELIVPDWTIDVRAPLGP